MATLSSLRLPCLLELSVTLLLRTATGNNSGFKECSLIIEYEPPPPSIASDYQFLNYASANLGINQCASLERKLVLTLLHL